MNLFTIGLAFSIISAAVFGSEIYIPLINQKLILAQENLLNSSASALIAQNRNKKQDLETILKNLNLEGIKINSVQKQSTSDFETYVINFSHTKILKNNFFTQNLINQSSKTIFLTVDK